MRLDQPSTVILAAGQSQRMGTPKPLLQVNGQTFLERVISNHRTVFAEENITVVLGYDFERISRHTDLRGLRIIRNPRPEDGPLSSLLCAYEHFKDSAYLLFHPVDHPMVTDSTLRALILRHEKVGDCILIPEYLGRRGHPVLIPHRFIPDLKAAPLSEGARWVVRHNRASVHHVPLDDVGVIQNIDTWEQYLDLTGRRSLVSCHS